MKKLLSIGKTVVVSAVVLLAGVAILGASLSSEYGTRIELEKGELFYTASVTPAEAESLAKFLNDQYGELDNEITFQADRVDGNACFRMCVQSVAWETDDLDASFMALEILLQTSVFAEENVKVQLCDQNMTVKKTIDTFPLETSNTVQDIADEGAGE